MDSLRSLSSPTATVLRDGNITAVASITVVPGDIVELKTGDVTPADIRLFDVMNFETDEALLTGESLPVHKNPEVYLQSELGVGDRINMAFSSTTVTKGRARGIVIGTGMSTEIGSIAGALAGKTKHPSRSMSRKKHGSFQPVKGASLKTWDGIGKLLGLTVGTPLQKKLSKLAYMLLGCAVLLAIIVFAVNKFHINHEVIIYAISLGVLPPFGLKHCSVLNKDIGISIIPESLIAVLTITMAIGMKHMSAKKVIVRKLDALEALGGVTNICSDKTGTLTQGKMVTRKAWVPGIGIYSVNRNQDAADPTSGWVRLSSASSTTKNTHEDKSDKRRTLRFADNLKPRTRRYSDNFGEDGGGDEDEKGMPEDYITPEVVEELKAFLHSAALCNLATVRFDKQKSTWQTTGDPTEVTNPCFHSCSNAALTLTNSQIALQVFAHRFDYGKKKLVSDGWHQLGEYPFDSDVKRMSVVFQEPNDGRYVIFVKGAVERIIDLCTTAGFGDYNQPMTEETRVDITGQMNILADQGLVKFHGRSRGVSFHIN